ncbi:MAG: sporulation protein YunB [Clostridia bacterium]|nr:sporulation protein YunB [Clostridia bacterium]
MASLFYRRVCNRVGYRLHKKHSGTIVVMLGLMGLLACAGYLYFYIFQPALLELGAARANRIGQEVIHESVEEVLAQNEFLGSQLVTVQTSDDGQIAAVLPDVAKMNQLKARLALHITEKLQRSDCTAISIPLGALSGVDFLASYGPRLQVNMLPYGRAWVDIESRFSDAGINQTRHQMLATVQVEVSLLMPDSRSCNAQIRATVPMSETVVVGSVPNSYTNLETEKENVKDDLLNLVE